MSGIHTTKIAWNLAGPVQPSVDWLHGVNRRDHNTQLYTGLSDGTLLVRRDQVLTFLVNCPTQDGVLTKDVTVHISGWVGEEYRFSVSQSQSPENTSPNSDYPGSAYSVSATQDGTSRVVVRLALAATAPPDCARARDGDGCQ